MREVDSSVLRGVAPALGIGNPVTAVEQVQFDDGVLQQVLDVAALIRRGGTLAGSSGLYMADIDQVHAAGGALITQIDPYAPSSPGAGYPSPVPAGFDVWLLSAQLAGSATGVQSATSVSRCTILVPGVNRAFGDAAPTNYSNEYAAFLTEQVIGAAGTVPYILPIGALTVNYRRAMRIQRGALIQLQSVAGAAGTLTWQLNVGLFPAALGEDAFGAS